MLRNFAFAMLLVIAAQDTAAGESFDGTEFDETDCRRSKLASRDIVQTPEFVDRVAHPKLSGRARPMPKGPYRSRQEDRKGRAQAPALRGLPNRRTLRGPNKGHVEVSGKGYKARSRRNARDDLNPPARAASTAKAERASVGRSGGKVTFPSGESLWIVKGRTGRGQRDFDPTRSGNPLLKTGGRERLKKLSDNFHAYELAHSGTKDFDPARIDPKLVVCLQRIRNFVGKPVKIDSGYRSFWHNNDVYRWMGRKPTGSQHIGGRAADIKIEGMTGLKIAQAAVEACGANVAVGIGLNFAHVDVRGYAVSWNYRGVSRRQVVKLERYRSDSRASQRALARKTRRGHPSKRI